MTRIHQKRSNERCTLCKRQKRAAIDEQVAKGEICASRDCEFGTEITVAIEKKFRLNILPVQKRALRISEKHKSTISIVKRR